MAARLSRTPDRTSRSAACDAVESQRRAGGFSADDNARHRRHRNPGQPADGEVEGQSEPVEGGSRGGGGGVGGEAWRGRAGDGGTGGRRCRERKIAPTIGGQWERLSWENDSDPGRSLLASICAKPRAAPCAT